VARAAAAVVAPIITTQEQEKEREKSVNGIVVGQWVL
jgi:hypothetical protein